MENSVHTKEKLQSAIMLGSFSFTMIAFMLPIYTKMLGGNAVSIGGLFSIFSIVTLLLRPFIGKGIDSYGRKKFLIAAFLINGLAMLLFSFSSSITHLYISRLIQALASSILWIAAYSVAMDLADGKNRGSEIGYVDGASSRGQLIGTFLGFIILAEFSSLMTGLSVLFIVYALLSFYAAYIVYKNIPETKVSIKKQAIKTKSKLSKGYKKLLIIVFISSFSSSMLSPIYMAFLMDRFTTNYVILSWCFVPAAIVYAFFQQKLGGISDKIGRTKPLAIGLIVSGIVSISLTQVYNLFIMVILWTILAVGMAMASPAETAFVADLTGDDIRGSSYGIYTLIESLGASIGPIVGGLLYESFGQTIPFYVNGVILLVSAILVFVLLENYKNKQKTELLG
ncbi:MFS transporter [Caldifermentibacillus hisashii]|uniref:MFS transporter n=1 Tax=Caldifermentibacillus hisashii TaxID=996558 RepID=A0ABU9JZD4_9BACI